MMKKLVVVFAVLGLMFQTSCTSKDSKQETEAVADYDAAEMAALEGAEGGGGDDALMSGELPEEALGEAAPAESKPNEVVTTETTTTVAEENPLDSAATVESTEKSTISEMAPAEPTAEVLPPVEPAQEKPVEETPSYTAMTEPAPTPTPLKSASLQKIKTAPFRENGILANTVYFARPGDSLASISQSIYGEDKSADLKKVNPSFKKRDVKPGDKVYFNSPRRPDDEARMMTWYEDSGMTPEVYVAKAGDNIRSVSKKLLGYSDAWKEVWSSNELESKGKMDEGTQIRYWAAAPVPAPAMPAQQEVAATLPPPPMPEASAELPPPPMPEEQMAQNEIPPPPPPPVAEQMAPPPPPPPPAPEVAQEAAPAEEAAPGMDEDMTLALTAVMIAAAGMAALIVVRKKRKQKEADQSLHTNVG